MNKTGIEWADYTWNPVTGCWGPSGTAKHPNRCSYCYAARIAQRFFKPFLGDDCTQPDTENFPFPTAHEIRYKKSGGAWRYGFAPTLHSYRLGEPGRVKKPSKIFVCSMGDLFGDWVPDEWIKAVKDVARDCYWHTFIFLTKNPKRYHKFAWPLNCWVGTTVTNQADADERLPWLLQVDASVRFVSHEPLLGGINLHPPYWYQWGCEGRSPDRNTGKLVHYHDERCRRPWDWVIIGAMTGPGAVKPEVDWIMDLAQQYRDAGVPLFLKDNLGFKDQPQEWPK
jgi:protein gp37